MRAACVSQCLRAAARMQARDCAKPRSRQNFHAQGAVRITRRMPRPLTFASPPPRRPNGLGRGCGACCRRSGTFGRPRRARHSWGLKRRPGHNLCRRSIQARHLELGERLSRDGALWLLQVSAQARANLSQILGARPERREIRRAESPLPHVPRAPRRRALRSRDPRRFARLLDLR